MGNTVGRLSKEDSVNFAYIAGFLDGDGSIMLQLHRRKANTNKYRVKTIVCFYQNSRYQEEVEWIRQILKCGYIYIRSDGICELRVEGFQRVFEILSKLEPYLKFKSNQAKLMLKVIPELQKNHYNNEEFVGWINLMRNFNYYSSQRNSLADVPVTTNNEGTR